jgi:prophage antirepressor-like protein
MCVVYFCQGPGSRLQRSRRAKGFYQIIFGSEKPEAIDFTEWVTGVVLPTLRRTGTFSVEKLPEKRKAEFDIETLALQLAKRICADVMETKVVQCDFL